jgi:hypothetical protein
MSLQSAIIGFLISKLLTIPITPQETVVMQSTAVATGTVCHRLKVANDIESSDPLSLDAACSRVRRYHPCIEFARRAERRIARSQLDLDVRRWLVLCRRLFWASGSRSIHHATGLTTFQRLHVTSNTKESGKLDS